GCAHAASRAQIAAAVKFRPEGSANQNFAVKNHPHSEVRSPPSTLIVWLMLSLDRPRVIYPCPQPAPACDQLVSSLGRVGAAGPSASRRGRGQGAETLEQQPRHLIPLRYDAGLRRSPRCITDAMPAVSHLRPDQTQPLLNALNSATHIVEAQL